MIRRSVWLLLVCVAACASPKKADEAPPSPSSDPASPSSGSKSETTIIEAKMKDTPEAAARRELRLGQTLMDLDKRVDTYAHLTPEPGEDARMERAQLGHAIEAQVAQYRVELLKVMEDSSNQNQQRRRVAAKALAFSDDPAAVTALVKCLGEKGDVVLLTNATFSLSRIRSPATPPEPLLALVPDLDADVRSNALLALWHVFDAKRKIGASPLDPVAQSGAVALLETALFDPSDPICRANAAAAIGALGDARSVDALVNSLRDAHPLVRTQTAIALGKIGDEKAIPALVTIIDTTQAGTPRTAVILSLRRLLEAKGVHPPESLGDEGRAWERFVRQQFGSGAEK